MLRTAEVAQKIKELYTNYSPEQAFTNSLVILDDHLEQVSRMTYDLALKELRAAIMDAMNIQRDDFRRSLGRGEPRS